MSRHRPTQLRQCGTLKPVGDVADNLVADLRFHRLVEKLHTLGPRAVGELLVEIGEQRGCRTFIDMRLKVYAEFDPGVMEGLEGPVRGRPPISSGLSSLPVPHEGYDAQQHGQRQQTGE